MFNVIQFQTAFNLRSLFRSRKVSVVPFNDTHLDKDTGTCTGAGSRRGVDNIDGSVNSDQTYVLFISSRLLTEVTVKMIRSIVVSSIREARAGTTTQCFWAVAEDIVLEAAALLIVELAEDLMTTAVQPDSLSVLDLRDVIPDHFDDTRHFSKCIKISPNIISPELKELTVVESFNHIDGLDEHRTGSAVHIGIANLASQIIQSIVASSVVAPTFRLSKSATTAATTGLTTTTATATASALDSDKSHSIYFVDALLEEITLTVSRNVSNNCIIEARNAAKNKATIGRRHILLIAESLLQELIDDLVKEVEPAEEVTASTMFALTCDSDSIEAEETSRQLNDTRSDVCNNTNDSSHGLLHQEMKSAIVVVSLDRRTSPSIPAALMDDVGQPIPSPPTTTATATTTASIVTALIAAAAATPVDANVDCSSVMMPLMFTPGDCSTNKSTRTRSLCSAPSSGSSRGGSRSRSREERTADLDDSDAASAGGSSGDESSGDSSSTVSGRTDVNRINADLNQSTIIGDGRAGNTSRGSSYSSSSGGPDSEVDDESPKKIYATSSDPTCRPSSQDRSRSSSGGSSSVDFSFLLDASSGFPVALGEDNRSGINPTEQGSKSSPDSRVSSSSSVDLTFLVDERNEESLSPLARNNSSNSSSSNNNNRNSDSNSSSNMITASFASSERKDSLTGSRDEIESQKIQAQEYLRSIVLATRWVSETEEDWWSQEVIPFPPIDPVVGATSSIDSGEDAEMEMRLYRLQRTEERDYYKHLHKINHQPRQGGIDVAAWSRADIEAEAEADIGSGEDWDSIWSVPTAEIHQILKMCNVYSLGIALGELFDAQNANAFEEFLDKVVDILRPEQRAELVMAAAAATATANRRAHWQVKYIQQALKNVLEEREDEEMAQLM